MLCNVSFLRNDKKLVIFHSYFLGYHISPDPQLAPDSSWVRLLLEMIRLDLVFFFGALEKWENIGKPYSEPKGIPKVIKGGNGRSNGIQFIQLGQFTIEFDDFPSS